MAFGAVFIPKLQEPYYDFILVEDYFAIKSSYMDMCSLIEKKPIEYPCNIVVVSGYEWVDIWGTEDDLKAKLEELIVKLK